MSLRTKILGTMMILAWACMLMLVFGWFTSFAATDASQRLGYGALYATLLFVVFTISTLMSAYYDGKWLQEKRSFDGYN